VILCKMQYFQRSGDIMGIFKFQKPKDKRYVTEEAFKKNSSKQAEALPAVLAVLKKHSLTDTNLRCLEFFFYTNTSEKAKLLAAELQKKEYSASYEKLGYNNKSFVITGWTRKISINDSDLAAWAKEMCELGYKYDCEFDGWGTDVDQ
jgi:regulator of RNase E activity RraB